MGKNQDQGSGINIPDPPHWVCGSKFRIANMHNKIDEF
jgi:hypothetical protein